MTVDGELFPSPRPAGLHSRVTTKLGARLDGPFDAGEGGPCGWIILDEPELHLGDDVLVPDLAGWRRERMPHVAEDAAAFDPAPDWICEALSPATGTLDRVRKMPVYAREGAQFAWLLEPIQRTLEVFQLQGQPLERGSDLGGQREVRPATPRPRFQGAALALRARSSPGLGSTFDSVPRPASAVACCQ